jgi:D-lactate dehydrogenase (cytochrome)
MHNEAVTRATARRPRPAAIELETDPDLIAQYLEDAAHYPGGHAVAIARPRDVDEVAAVVRQAGRILPVGARSSLTGGATPAGDVVLSTERLKGIRVDGTVVEAGAGVTLQTLQEFLTPHRLWLPSVPTFLGATVGGAVSTNAAGASTFKYGAMREWVEGLTLVLPDGDVLTIARGEVIASDDGTFTIESGGGERRIEVPRITMPDVPKRSAGYFAAPGMDLVDLFVGAEGTLGVIVSARLRVQPRPAGICWVMTPLASESAAIALTGALREAARATWRSGDIHGIDLAAIEHLDRRSLEVVRDDGVDVRLGIQVSAGTDVILLTQLELHEVTLAAVLSGDQGEGSVADSPIARLAELLQQHGVLETSEVSLPSDARRAAAFVELREAVPAGVNRRVAIARQREGRIHKTAADMIVPFAHFASMMRECRRQCAERGLDLAVWGHISDGNVHPNVIPRSFEDVVQGKAVLLELARQVIAMGGCPLAEHGVGRNPVKQEMLRMLYGESGVAAMRRVKLSLDPDWKLAPGVLFADGAASSRESLR